MALEPSVVNISDLNPLWPLGGDPASISDDNHRNLKKALLNDFAGFTGAVLVTGTDGGAVNAYTLTPTTTLPAYGTKMIAVFAPTVTNTSACTMNISALGVKNIKSVSGADLVAGDLVSGSVYSAFYNGTEFRLLSITKQYADQLAFGVALPAQPGDTIVRYLSTLSGVASWILIGITRTGRTASTIITKADNGQIIQITANSFTQAIDTPANLGAGCNFEIHNDGTGDITITNADGLASYYMYPGEHRRFDTDGVTLVSDVRKPYYRKGIANYTRIQPPGYSGVDIDMVGAPGGAGSGRKGAAGSLRTGGSPGGTPCRIRRRFVLPAGTSTAVAIGAPGASGVAQTVDSTNGNPGANGGSSTFGTLATALGGIGGLGGQNTNIVGLTTGSGAIARGTSTGGGAGFRAMGGEPAIQNSAILQFNANADEGGAGARETTAGNGLYGGGAATSADNSATAIIKGGSSLFGIPAGGYGGWVTTGDAFPNPAPGAGMTGGWDLTGAAGGTCGAVPTVGANGAANAGTDLDMGNSGGGGGSTATAGVDGKAGGNGSFPAGAPGGGGACVNGAGNSGPGGVGQGGQILEWGIL